MSGARPPALARRSNRATAHAPPRRRARRWAARSLPAVCRCGAAPRGRRLIDCVGCYVKLLIVGRRSGVGALLSLPLAPLSPLHPCYHDAVAVRNLQLRQPGRRDAVRRVQAATGAAGAAASAAGATCWRSTAAATSKRRCRVARGRWRSRRRAARRRAQTPQVSRCHRPQSHGCRRHRHQVAAVVGVVSRCHGRRLSQWS